MLVSYQNRYVIWESIAPQVLFHSGVFVPQVILSWIASLDKTWSFCILLQKCMLLFWNFSTLPPFFLFFHFFSHRAESFMSGKVWEKSIKILLGCFLHPLLIPCSTNPGNNRSIPLALVGDFGSKTTDTDNKYSSFIPL